MDSSISVLPFAPSPQVKFSRMWTGLDMDCGEREVVSPYLVEQTGNVLTVYDCSTRTIHRLDGWEDAGIEFDALGGGHHVKNRTTGELVLLSTVLAGE
jgi:hypothetical protein